MVNVYLIEFECGVNYVHHGVWYMRCLMVEHVYLTEVVCGVN